MKPMILPANECNIERIANHLRKGKTVALPTETVYGLAALASNGDAVASIFSAKGRPFFNPLIAHVSNIMMAQRCTVIDKISQKLMENFWSGPLTFVLPLREKANIHPLVTAGLSTLAIRSPYGIFKDIIACLDAPVVAPSANTSGKTSPTTAAAVARDLGKKIPLIIDGGPCSVGIESTIIRVSGEEIFLLRPGGISCQEIEEVAGLPVRRSVHVTGIESPGMMPSHYAPDTIVRPSALEVYPGEALLAFGSQRIKGWKNAVKVLNLSPSGDTKQAAMNLFDYLASLDRMKPASIAVEPVSESGLGEAINDRLFRAAAPKEKK